MRKACSSVLSAAKRISGNAPHAQTSERLPDEGCGSGETSEGLLALEIASDHSHEDARHPEVGGHFDPGNGWDPYAGVAHVPAEDVGDLPAELLVEPLDPSTRHEPEVPTVWGSPRQAYPAGKQRATTPPSSGQTVPKSNRPPRKTLLGNLLQQPAFRFGPQDRHGQHADQPDQLRRSCMPQPPRAPLARTGSRRAR